MANKQSLVKALQSSYDRILFATEVLKPVFGGEFELYNTLLPSDIQPNQTESQAIQQVGIYGKVMLEDSTVVTCYEILLQPKVRIEQSKVTIQNYVRKLLLTGEAALVNFVAPVNKDTWRFTLVAKDSRMNEDGEIKEELTHAKRYTYLVEKDRPNHTLAEGLERLSHEAKLDLAALIKAFSVEIMSDEFFEEYRHHYQNFVQYLTGKRMVKVKGKWKEQKLSKPSPFLSNIFNDNEKDARDFCKKLLGRIIFLYFLQKKRWLGASNTSYEDGPQDFVYQIFEETGGDERFFPHGLSDLFFNALNKERPNDDYITPGKGRKVKIPYLNGGLFTRDRVDELLHKKGDIMTFPAKLFSNNLKDVPLERGFLDFLNAYNFTVYEDSPDDHTVAVDPEMLGHIFENLLEDNKDKGAFYTPKEIVRYMCQESLAEYLTTHLSKEYKVYKRLHDDQIELFGNDGRKGQLNLLHELGDKTLRREDIDTIVKEKDIANLTVEQLKRIDSLLDAVKICDPAIGSGAFPMGLLQEIFTIKEIIAYELKVPWNPAKVKENIIQNSIYGVDIERGAVDIARLRFWLSLVVDTEKPKALPNLDYKIVVGNSLLSKFGNQVIEIDWDIDTVKHGFFGQQQAETSKKLLTKITEKQKAYFDPEIRNKELVRKEIRQLKIELLINQMELMIKTKGIENSPQGFGKKLKQQNERYIETLGWKQTILDLQQLQQQPDKDFEHFDWDLDFPDVLNQKLVGKNKGFDIVIANPPYLRVQEIARTMPDDKKHLENKYDVAKKSYDLANLFFELAVNLANDQSSNCFIFPHKFFNSSSTEAFRDYLWQGKYIDKIVHFGANMIFNDADTYTCIAHFSPRHNEGFELIKLEFGEDWKKSILRLNFAPITYEKLESASKLYGTNQWIFFNSDEAFESFSKIYSQSRHFDNIFECFVGLQTSNDKLYFLSLEEEDDHYLYGFIDLDDELIQVEKTFFKPILKGKDVQRYSHLNTNLYVFFPYEILEDKAKPVALDVLKNSYPKTFDYVKKYEKEFKARESGKAGKMKVWYAYIYPKNLTKFEQIKLSSMEICSDHPNVTLNDKYYYHPTTVYSWVKKEGVMESYEFFLAIANSSLMWWFQKNTGDTLQGDARRFKTNYLNPFPLPKEVSKKTDALFKTKVREILQSKKIGQDTTELECEVDVMVFKLYDLTYEEAIRIAPDLWLDEKAYENFSITEASKTIY